MGRLDDLRDDLRFAARQMRRTPGYTAVALLTLALGIGVNSAIFALVDATLLRPLPFPAPDRLVMIWERSDTTLRGRVAPLNAVDWDERNRTFDGIATYLPNVGGMVMAGDNGIAENVSRQWVPSARIFDVLGVRPIVGRTFLPSDETSRANVVVLSEGFWRSRFNADPSLVGRSLRLDGAAFTVLGVVPREAHLIGDTDLWALRPVGRDPAMRAPRALLAVGRLKPGVTIEQASTDLTAIAAALEAEYPEVNAGRGVMIEPLRDALVGSDLRRTSLLFLGVVGFVLLICCANVANLLLARASARGRELAIRSALGAGRRRIVRQLLTESLVLSLIGGALGLALGGAILAAAPTIIPPGLLPGAVTLTFDGRVVAFCLATALGVGVLFGLAPAWQGSRFSAPQASAADTRTTTGAGGAIRSALVVGEIAAAVLLLFGAGLLLRTLVAVTSVDRGYRADDALTMIVDPMASSYPTPASLKQFFDEVEREILSAPGVRSVAWTSTLPLGPSYTDSFAFEIVGDPPLADSQRPTAVLSLVSGTYFDTIDLPIVAGRAFSEHDTRESVQVCIVNEAFVRRYLQGRSPIGVRLALRPAEAPQAKPMVREIVGVARQVQERPDATSEFVQVYVPTTQMLLDDMFVVVRPDGAEAAALGPAVRAAIARVDKAQLVAVRAVQTLDDIVADGTSRHRFRAVLVLAFAGLALVLAMVGVFGTLTYSVQQRVRELGVRMALGASAARVLALVVGGAFRLIAVGVAIGLALAALTSRLIASLLVGVEPLDPATFAMVTAVLAGTALLSTIAPALRAVRVNPAATLRAE